MIGLGAAAVLALTVACAPAQSAAPGEHPDDRGHGHGHAHRHGRLSVATYNIYLGADLNPLFRASTPVELAQAAASVYAQMERTDFPRRAEAIADLIAGHEPSIIGLQEVALWQRGPLGGALATTYDFQQLLLDALAARGLDYEPVATNTNFQGQAQVSATETAAFTDRDVILARSDVPSWRLKVRNPRSATFEAVLSIPSQIPGLTFQVPRGYSTVDVRSHGSWVRVANTHLEAFGTPPTIREQQGRELIAALRRSPYPVVVLGDLNTCPQATDPCTPDSTYEDFIAAGYVDTWAELQGIAGGWTSGQSADLDDPNELTHRIDYVLHSRHRVRGRDVEVIGDEEADRTGGNPSLWPSDHAGVVAVLKLRHR
jgi:endonuclease/exonuclease/phosphatase family metal-dependent hydrolase